MFRDSRGVVHTVSSADPLDDLPAEAVKALQEALLRPLDGDLGSSLERCDAVRELVERWQDAFFESLPESFDLDEERRWAIESGMSADEFELAYGEEEDDAPVDLMLLDGEERLELVIDEEEADPSAVLPDELVSVLERELLLLPVRTRLEALIAAADLVENWSDLLADEEKLVGHLVLRHAATAELPREHEALADRHGELHAATGPRHDG